MEKSNISFFKKIAPYLLFIFTISSFVISDPVLILISIILALLGFVFINTFQLFSKYRYVSILNIFLSLLLFVRLYLLLEAGFFYELAFGFIILNLILIYVLYFSNFKPSNIDVFGSQKIKNSKSKNSTKLKEKHLDDFLENDDDEDEDEDFDLEEKDNNENVEDDDEEADDDDDEDEDWSENDFDVDDKDKEINNEQDFDNKKKGL